MKKESYRILEFLVEIATKIIMSILHVTYNICRWIDMYVNVQHMIGIHIKNKNKGYFTGENWDLSGRFCLISNIISLAWCLYVVFREIK